MEPRGGRTEETRNEASAEATLALSGDFGQGELEVLCSELEGLPERRGRVDLRRLGTIAAGPLAVLVAAMRGAQRGGDQAPELRVVGASDPREDAGLDSKAVAALGTKEGGHWARREGGEVIGWQVFASGEGTLEAALHVARRLHAHTGWSAGSCTGLASSALELAENVRQHSRSPEGVVALELSAEEQRARLAIADTGIGIQASLARNPRYSEIDDDLTAIEAAMEAGASGEPGTGGGMGLYLTRALVRGNGGTLLVRSGDASCEEGEERRRKRRLARLRGTLIEIEARTDRALDDEEIRQRLEALGGG